MSLVAMCSFPTPPRAAKLQSRWLSAGGNVLR